MSTRVKLPPGAEFRRVDDVIECYDIGEETRRELMEKVPDAYGGDPPGEDDWPEPDAARDAPYKLKVHWHKLSDAAKADIARAFDEEDAKWK